MFFHDTSEVVTTPADVDVSTLNLRTSPETCVMIVLLVIRYTNANCDDAF